jgi:hypothetical protein
MQNLKQITLSLVATLALASCSKDDNNAPVDIAKPVPTEAAFKGIKEKGLKTSAQKFILASADASKAFTSAKGVKFTIVRANLTNLDGSPVTGDIDIEYNEIFDGGHMLTTDKPSMGIMPDGNQSLLISGGEIFLNAKVGSLGLKMAAPINVEIPADLTKGLQGGMLLWAGVIDKDNNLAWEKPRDAVKPIQGGAAGTQASYSTPLSSFGWTNVDKFYNDPRPKTAILAAVPTGYNATNSAVYLHYDGQGSALAKLDRYDTATSLFTEHYGQIPIGLVCHMIFVTEDAGQWRYAIKALTISAGATYTFTLAETTVGSQAQLEAAINALP